MKYVYLHRALCASLAALTLLSSTPSAFAADFTGGFTASLTATVSGVVIADGDYQVGLYDDQSMGWNIQYASTEIDEAHMVVDGLNMESNEIFRVVNRGNGLISIHPLHALDLCLNAQYGAACEKGSDVILHNYEDGDTASLWQPIRHADGSYTLKNAACNYVIDLNHGNYSVGNNFLLWSHSTAIYIQSFYFMPVDSAPSNPGNPSVSDRQQRMADVALSYLGNTGYNGYCQKFVRVVGEKIGLPSGGAPTALDACDWWRVSTSMDNIPVGATVYLRSKKRSSLGYKYGHVGIYIGNGQVVHAQETVKQSSLSSMLNSYDYLGWGWQAGVDLR